MKRILDLTVCLALVFSFVSCENSENASSRRSDKSREKHDTVSEIDSGDEGRAEIIKAIEPDEISETESYTAVEEHTGIEDDTAVEDNTDAEPPAEPDYSKADETAYAYAQCYCEKYDGETYCRLTLPDEYIEILKNTEPVIPSDMMGNPLNSQFDYVALIYNINRNTSRQNGLPQPEFVSVNRIGALTKDQLETAGSSFIKQYDTPFVIDKGYEYQLEYAVDLDSGESIGILDFWVVNSGKEWKVCNESYITTDQY